MSENVTAKTQTIKKEMEQLVLQGTLLEIAMHKETDLLTEEVEREIASRKLDIPAFASQYDKWYSVAMQVVKQVLPDRLEDFVLQYRNPKRKTIDFETYTISDYLLGLKVDGITNVNRKAAIPKFRRQLSILNAAKAGLESRLIDITQVLQADLFDSELDAAAALCKRGFARAAGAVAGVVLEKHLSQVCTAHGVSIAKKNPTINDYNQTLKDKDIVSTPVWRFVQHLADLRNLCDHAKGKEPTHDQVSELISGVAKISKTVC